MRRSLLLCFSGLLLLVAVAAAQNESAPSPLKQEALDLQACAATALKGFRPIADTRDQRFHGKVSLDTALCRGGREAAQYRYAPWIDFANYWGTGDLSSLPQGYLSTSAPKFRGVNGALFDLEYQRIELIKFNLFDNTGTYQQYVEGREGVAGPSLKSWPQLRLPPSSPYYAAVGGDGTQVCTGELIRGRNLTGICNDTRNPLMGSTGMPFARNVEFEATFPDLSQDQLARNRHGGRISLLVPDPQLISRKLFTRQQTDGNGCNNGFGSPTFSNSVDCDYQKAPFFNVLAAYWIQFMTHDWFSHMEEGHNAPETMAVGCTSDEARRLGCDPRNQVDKGYVLQDSAPDTFTSNNKAYMTHAPKTFANNNTAWWDASQIYGYDDTSVKRVKRDPNDPAKLLMVSVPGRQGGYLPVLATGDPAAPQWAGQESTGFPDNWTIGMSFYHNLFAREHNTFVDEFRKQASRTPNDDSGLRNPANPKQMIRYKDVSADELYEAARLVVSAEIAKVHTIEWTPQLLYDEPLYKGMNANWNGLVGTGDPDATKVMSDIVTKGFGKSTNATKTTQWYSVFASGPGIFGMGSKVPHYDFTKAEYNNGGVNHFGSPFNFPEEFVTVYRLHPLVPDLIEVRDVAKDPNQIVEKVAVIETFEGKATGAMRSRGMANWGLSMGRQRLGLLTLHNHPVFLQSIKLPRLDTPTQQVDIPALDLIRDREHGVPRFNEFRRQYGLKQLTSYDDFVDQHLPPDSPQRKQQEESVKQLREVYGTHVCDSSKVITDAQVNDDRTPINDCLGHPNGSVVDNIEDVDTIVGWLAEFTRPHGYAISETQFVVFILNASRRLFSDRFFTSSFRPEFYTQFGVDWVNNNGPGPVQMEAGTPNGHKQPVSPLKRVMMRNVPELQPELKNVVNVFDPWGRDRGQYYSLQWVPRPETASDPAFKK